MKILKTWQILPALILVLSISCNIFRSPEKRADAHLKKAISLDPTILQSSLKDSVHIIDSIKITDSIRVKDSISIITKDSTIITPKSDLNGVVESPCDPVSGLIPFDYTLGSGVHKLHIWSDGKKIRYSSTVDELVSKIQSRDTYIIHLEDSLHSVELLHSQEVAKLKKDVVTLIDHRPTTWQVIKLVGLGLLIGLIVGFVASKFKLLGF
jgi:hypothetical protein